MQDNVTVNEGGKEPRGFDMVDLLESMPCLAWSARPDGTSDFYNTRFLEYLGISEEEMRGWKWLETLHPDDRQRSIDAWTEERSHPSGE